MNKLLFMDLIPEEIIKKLQCAYCLNLLSTPNVTVPDDSEYFYACGRCSKACGSSVRATAYEAIAQMIKFPCAYSKFGCNKQLSWGTVLDHEKACKHRVYSCVDTKCNWKGNTADLKIHIQESHGNILIAAGSFKLPKRNLTMVNVLFAYGEVFLIEYKYIYKDMFTMNIKYIGKPSESGRFTCEIEMKSAHSKRVNCIKIYSGKIKAFTDYDYDDLCKDMDIKVDASTLEAIVKSLNIICTIHITEKVLRKEKIIKQPKTSTNNVKVKNLKIEKKEICINMQDNVDLKKPSKPDLDARKNILRQLECPVCHDYISSQIFICNLGHNVCGSCKSKLTKCPICSAKYGNARNYAMEGMLQLIMFPCDNESHGCTFTGIITDIKEHKNNCKYENFQCPALNDCKWMGTIELLPMHLKTFHEKSIYVKLNDVVTYDVKLGDAIHNLAEFETNIFRISCKLDKKGKRSMQWSFQKLCSKDYMIEIEFIDQTNSDRKFVINDIFCDMTDNMDIFNKTLSIPLALLQPYINSSKVLYFILNIK